MKIIPSSYGELGGIPPRLHSRDNTVQSGYSEFCRIFYEFSIFASPLKNPCVSENEILEMEKKNKKTDEGNIPEFSRIGKSGIPEQ